MENKNFSITSVEEKSYLTDKEKDDILCYIAEKTDNIKLSKYWHSLFCIAMSILGSTWGALIGSLVIWLLTKK